MLRGRTDHRKATLAVGSEKITEKAGWRKIELVEDFPQPPQQSSGGAKKQFPFWAEPSSTRSFVTRSMFFDICTRVAASFSGRPYLPLPILAPSCVALFCLQKQRDKGLEARDKTNLFPFSTWLASGSVSLMMLLVASTRQLNCRPGFHGFLSHAACVQEPYHGAQIVLLCVSKSLPLCIRAPA